MSAPPIRRAKKPTAKKEDDSGAALKMAIAVVGVCIFGVLLSIWPESAPAGSFSGSPNSGLEKYFEQKGIKLNGARVLCSGRCRLVATRPVAQGEPVITFPITSVIDPRSLNETAAGQIAAAEEFSVLKEFMEKPSFGQGFVNVFNYAFFLALEKRNSYSEHAGWINAMRPVEDLPSAITWDPSMDVCLEQSLQSEAETIRSWVDASVEAAEKMCEQDSNKDLCAKNGGAPNKKDFQWAISAYLAGNFQDQAILPGVDFAQITNSRGGIAPQFDQNSGNLHMVAQDNYKKGEIFAVNFNRGPGSLLASQGFFDRSTTGIDAKLRVDPNTKDTMVKKYCVDKYHDLVFAHNGRPRESLINCIGIMIATQENKAWRKNFKTAMKKEKDLRMYVYGNLTGLLQQNQQQLTTAVTEAQTKPQCKRDASPLATEMAEYREFAHSVLSKNLAYCHEMYQSFDPPAPPTPGNVEMQGSADLTPEGVEAENDEEAPETP